ncbi:MAG: hypothetical protein IPF47_19850 [Gemmatimonadetes bacterium]|nr:hypothetical protein [Gemmatimonadota bacterium]
MDRRQPRRHLQEGVARRAAAAPDERPAQYGSIAVAPDGARVAYVRGAPGLAGGMWLSNETEFDLVVREGDGSQRRITGISGHALGTPTSPARFRRA